MKKLLFLLSTCILLASCKIEILPHPREVWLYKLDKNVNLRVHVVSVKYNLVTYRYIPTKHIEQLSTEDFTCRFKKVRNAGQAPLFGTKQWLLTHDH